MISSLWPLAVKGEIKRVSNNFAHWPKGWGREIKKNKKREKKKETSWF
jgi:hypothetical protein